MKKINLLSTASISFTTTEFALLSETILKAGRSIRFRAPGISMQPLIQDGDQLMVAPVETERIRRGDILFFISEGGRALVHRVIKRQKSDGFLCFVMQGDHVSHPDGCVTPSMILGRVTLIERNGEIIRTDGILMKTLGKVACWYSLRKPGSTKLATGIFHLARRLPGINKYLT